LSLDPLNLSFQRSWDVRRETLALALRLRFAGLLPLPTSPLHSPDYYFLASPAIFSK
jgi:hypothetical protein